MTKILVLKLGALGDIVMATPIIRQIQQHHPNDKIFLLTSPPFAGIFADWPGLHVITFARKGWRASLKTLAWIRSQAFARIYDLQSSDRSRIYCSLSKTPVCIGNHPSYPYTIHPPNRYVGNCHIFTRLNQVLTAAGVPSTEGPVYLPLSEDKKKPVLTWLKKHNLKGRPFAIMHAGASQRHPKKRWPWYGNLAKSLDEKGITTVWIGGPEDQGVNKTLATICGIDTCNTFSINQLAELGRHANFAVTNDSAPMHALSGSGIAVFAFFGPTNWLRSHALGQKQNVITLQSETVIEKKIDGPQSCLANISSDKVLQRLRQHGLLD